jgi:exfoliative toxin A/B
MILGSYFYEMGWAFGKPLWAIGLFIHAVHILIFTYRNVIRERNIDTFIPSWFATYNGIMVSCVVGGIMNEADKLKFVVFYGIAAYVIIVPIMVWRLIKFDVKPAMYHAQAVILAPCSLCVVGIINITPWMPAPLLYILYACVIASLIFVISLLPKAFAYDFYPGYAGITFPMAIGIVATNKFAGYLAEHGGEALSGKLTQIGGFQLYLTTMIIGYVLLKFFNMLIRQKPVKL